jgi:FkbM family methyltransferase
MMSAYLVENKHVAVKRCRHGVMAYNRNDAFIGMSLDHYGEWCEFELALLRSVVPVGGTVIDAGANIGTHAVAFANMVGPQGKVFAFEPQPRLFHLLCANVALNGLTNVETGDEVLADEGGTVAQLPALPPDDTFCNFGAISILKAGNGPQVVTARIDDLGLTSCALIKADVEGMEPHVIRGALETIERCQPVLYIENNGEDSAAIAPVLEQTGYRAFWSIGNYYSPQNFYANPMNIWPNVAPSANLIAFPKTAEIRFSGSMPEFAGAQDNWRDAVKRMRA